MNGLLVYQADRWLESRLDRLPFPVRSMAPYRRDEITAALADTQVMLHALEPVTAEQIAAAPDLRLIQKIGVGVNTIDLAAAKARGIAVCNMPGTNTTAVVEHTLLLMLACLRRLPVQDQASHAGEGWSDAVQAAGAYGEMAGRTVGLVGFGAVPQRLAPILEAMGATVLRWHRSDVGAAPGRRVELDELLAAADIVSLHLPLVPETTKLLDAASFARMKEGAILVNTARGGLVDEAALLASLDAGRLAGAGLDVLATEPFPADHPLLTRDEVVLTPHSAWLTRETWDRSLEVIAENVRRLGSGEDLLHRVA